LGGTCNDCVLLDHNHHLATTEIYLNLLPDRVIKEFWDKWYEHFSATMISGAQHEQKSTEKE